MLEGSRKTCQQQRQGGQNKGGEPPKENVQDKETKSNLTIEACRVIEIVLKKMD